MQPLQSLEDVPINQSSKISKDSPLLTFHPEVSLGTYKSDFCLFQLEGQLKWISGLKFREWILVILLETVKIWKKLTKSKAGFQGNNFFQIWFCWIELNFIALCVLIKSLIQNQDWGLLLKKSSIIASGFNGNRNLWETRTLFLLLGM